MRANKKSISTPIAVSSVAARAEDSDSDESFRDIPAATATPTHAPTPVSAPVSLPAHEKYFFEDGMTSFLVENRLFRVHDYLLTRESEELRTTVDVLRPQGTVPLKDVTASGFETLLDFLFEGMHDDFSLSVDGWIAVLSFATRYDMQRVHSRAVREIANHSDAIDDVRKIVLAKDFHVNEWLAPAYTALCVREEPLDLPEAEQLGLETTVKIARTREALRKNRVPSTEEGQAVVTPAAPALGSWGVPSPPSVGSMEILEPCPIPREEDPSEFSQAAALVKEIFDGGDHESDVPSPPRKMVGKKGKKGKIDKS